MEDKQGESIIEFANELTQFCKALNQGTVLFFNADGKHGKLIIENGIIVSLRYDRKENEDALATLPPLESVRYCFNQYRLSPKKRINLSVTEFLSRAGIISSQRLANNPIDNQGAEDQFSQDSRSKIIENSLEKCIGREKSKSLTKLLKNFERVTNFTQLSALV